MKTWHLVLYVHGFEVQIPFLVDEDVDNNDAYTIGETFAKNFPCADYSHVDTSPC